MYITYRSPLESNAVAMYGASLIALTFAVKAPASSKVPVERLYVVVATSSVIFVVWPYINPAGESAVTLLLPSYVCRLLRSGNKDVFAVNPLYVSSVKTCTEPKSTGPLSNLMVAMLLVWVSADGTRMYVPAARSIVPPLNVVLPESVTVGVTVGVTVESVFVSCTQFVMLEIVVLINCTVPKLLATKKFWFA